jgi:CSLREA domain-containing protein
MGWLVAAVATAIALAPSSALADNDSFTVDSVGDGADVAADNSCDADAGIAEVCTLRAAIQESNDGDPALDGDSILFHANFNGEVANDTIDLGSALPSLNERGTIACLASLTNQPCAGIDSPPAGQAAFVVGGSDVSISGVSVTNALIGVNVIPAAPSDEFSLYGSWIGLKLDGSAGSNATGVFLDPNMSMARIGQLAGNRNVFGNNTNAALKLFGADDNTIVSNFFGVEADGATQAANAIDIAISGNSVGPVPATGNVIGGALSDAEEQSAACDGPCNVISGAGDGINLAAPLAGDIPADSTDIIGNHIGLDQTGIAAVENSDDGIDAGAADTEVQQNAITGGTTGFTGGSQDEIVELVENKIGTNSLGTASLDPPTDFGIQVVSGTTDDGAQVDLNRISMVTGTAVELTGEEGDILDTRIGIGAGGQSLPGPPVGISVKNGSDGNRIRGNDIGDANNVGIELVNSDNNSLTGNDLIANGPGAFGGNGIEIYGASGADDNEIGDDTADNANVISGVDGAPIEIFGDGNDGHVIGRNSGSGNGEMFADLGVAGFGNDAAGPNNGILAPVVKSARRGKDKVKGTGTPGATVIVYRALGGAPTGLSKYLGEAVVGAGGGWKLNPAGKLKTNWRVSANQTVDPDGSSEFAKAKRVKP